MLYLLWILSPISIIIFIYILKWSRDKSKYWSLLGFDTIDSKVTKSSISIIFSGILQHEMDKILYNHVKNEVKKPFAGFMEFTKPTLFVTDLNLAKQILVKDFDVFINRREFNAMEETDPMLFKMLFFMESEAWKELRGKMSPTFTTGKIRRMFDIFNTSSNKLVDHLRHESKLGDNNGTVNFIDAYERYTMDVIASAAFGVDAKTFSDKDPIFRKMGKGLQLEIGPKVMFTFVLMIAAPKLARALSLGLLDKKMQIFFTQVILSAIEHREKSGEVRDDFLQLMLEARNGQLKAVDEVELSAFEKEGGFVANNKGANNKQDKVALTDEIIVAQSVLFILAGFDTTQTLLLFIVYELAINPDVQEILSEEIEDSFKKSGGKFTYDSINHLEYLDKVVNETLRKYPPAPRLERRTNAEYKIPGSELKIPKQVLVAIPTYAIHHDEEHFPNPNRFDPERFSPEAKAERHPYAFSPFGHGPRNCIGMRFALTNVKMAIANIVHNFIIVPSEKTLIPMKFGQSSSLKPQSMFLKLKSRT